jgi:RND superfamily putative drug exporter
VTVGVAMAGMLLSESAIFVSLAIGTILVVAVAVLGSVTVLPAVLARLGRWVDRPRVPVLHRLTMHRSEPRMWPALLRPVLRRPAIALVVSAGLLAVLAMPAVGMRTRLLGTADLPRSIPIVASFDRLTTAFPSEGDSHLVAVEAPASAAPAVRAALLDLDRRAGADRLFAVDGPADVRASADGRVHLLEVPTPYAPGTDEARHGLTALRGTLVPQTVGQVTGAEVAVGGSTAASADFSHSLSSRLPWVFAFVLTLTFGLMLWAFRSPVIAATAIVLNLLSVGAAYGLLVLVFQHHWAEGLLGFQSNGAIVAWIPMFLFVVLFGLSMDYHVFVVSRIREAALAGMPTRDAVRHGVTSSAGAVTSAAVVMVAVFSIFATLSTLDFKQLGIGLGAAILIDATVVRAVLLPAAMALLGRWNWWAPAFLRGGRPRRVSAVDVDRLPVGSGVH